MVPHQFQHVIDLAPTVLEAAGLPQPTMVNGMTQRPMEGASLLHTFNDAKAKSRHTTQYFNLAAIARSIATGTVHHHAAQGLLGSGARASSDGIWELYNAEEDFSLTNDLAAKYPEKVEALKALFLTEAVK